MLCRFVGEGIAANQGVSGILLKMTLLAVPPVVRLTILGLPVTFPWGLGLAGVTWGQVGYTRKGRNRAPCWVPDTVTGSLARWLFPTSKWGH